MPAGSRLGKEAWAAVLQFQDRGALTSICARSMSSLSLSTSWSRRSQAEMRMRPIRLTVDTGVKPAL